MRKLCSSNEQKVVDREKMFVVFFSRFFPLHFIKNRIESNQIEISSVSI